MSIIARSKQNYQVEITAGNHVFLSDEPLGTGDDAGPSPYHLLLASLGSCVVITLHMYARRKNWPLESVQVELDIFEDPTSRPDSRLTIIEKRLTFQGQLSAEQTNRLIEIAERCPVHRTLSGKIEVRSSLKSAV